MEYIEWQTTRYNSLRIGKYAPLGTRKKEEQYSSIVDVVTAPNDRREHAPVAACSRRGKWNADKLSRFENDRRRQQKEPHRPRPSRSSSGLFRWAAIAAFILV